MDWKSETSIEEKRSLVEEQFGRGPYPVRSGIMGCSFIAFHYLACALLNKPERTDDLDVQSGFTLQELRGLYKIFRGRDLPEDFRWSSETAAPTGPASIRIHKCKTHLGEFDVVTVCGPEVSAIPYTFELRGCVWHLYSVIPNDLHDPDAARGRSLHFAR